MKAAGILPKSPAPVGPTLASHPGGQVPAPPSRDVVDLLSVEEQVIRDSQHVLPGAPPLSDRLEAKVQHAAGVLGGDVSVAPRGSSVSAGNSHTHFTLFPVSASSATSGFEALADMVKAEAADVKIDAASELSRELKQLEALYPTVLLRHPIGLMPSLEYLDLAIAKLAPHMTSNPRSSSGVRRLNQVKDLLRHSALRATNEGELGPYILGFVALAAVHTVSTCDACYVHFFEPVRFPNVVPPQVWLECGREAEHAIRRVKLQERILTVRHAEKARRDTSYWRAITPGVRTAEGKTVPAPASSPSDLPRAGKSDGFRWVPVSDGWSPVPNPLDQVGPSLELLNALRGCYLGRFGAPTAPCKHCGLDHKSEHICHLHKFPAYRSKTFNYMYQLVRSKGFTRSSQVEEWNSRLGRLAHHKSLANGQHSKGWKHLRAGLPGGPSQ